MGGKQSKKEKQVVENNQQCKSVSSKLPADSDLVIAWDENFSEIEISRGSKARKQSRIEKIKSRKLPFQVRVQTVDEESLRKNSFPGQSRSSYHMTHIEKIKRRKMPVGKRVFGPHYGD